ncbi:unnamed protein product [Lathyrus sativus]|nr:unnamed protein product [Lathyrus sativus]
MNAKDLVEVFKVYGVISEVFIPGRRDKRGRRFGFAKFRKVHNPRILACNLDSVVLEGKKLFVNIPRFRKEHKKMNPDGENVRKLNQPGRPRSFEKFDTFARSYAKVVSGVDPKPDGKDLGGGFCTRLDVEDEWVSRLKRMRVTVVLEDRNAFNIQKVINEEGFFNIKAIPLGASMCLLEDTSGGDIEEFIKESSEWLDVWFSEIRPWDQEVIDKDRFIWVKCYGLPCVAWSENNFWLIPASLGTYVKCDEKTRNKECLDVARFLIKTSLGAIQNKKIFVEVNRLAFSLSVTEEALCGCDSLLVELLDSVDFESSGPSDIDDAWEMLEEDESGESSASINVPEVRAPTAKILGSDYDHTSFDNVSVVGDNLGLSATGGGLRGSHVGNSADPFSSDGPKIANHSVNLELNQFFVANDKFTLNGELVVDLGLPTPLTGPLDGVLGPANRGKAKNKKLINEIYNYIKIPYTPSYFSTLLLMASKGNAGTLLRGSVREDRNKNSLNRKSLESCSDFLCGESITDTDVEKGNLRCRRAIDEVLFKLRNCLIDLGVQGKDEDSLGIF